MSIIADTAEIIMVDEEGRQPLWSIRWVEFGPDRYGWVVMNGDQIFNDRLYSCATSAGQELDLYVTKFAEI